VATAAVDRDRIRGLVRDRLLTADGVNALEQLGAPDRRLRVRRAVVDVLREEGAILSAAALAKVVNQVSDEVVGLGPIERLLRDPEVSEVMVNGADDVYVERKGRVEKVEGLFVEGEEQVLHLIERIVSPLGLRVDESCPYVDARLPDGSRVNAIIPPLSLCGPVITIRKFSLRAFSPEDLVRLGTVGSDVMRFLGACVRARMNLVVSGGTGSGKTTLLNVLSSFIPAEERLITIEDAAELRLSQPHVVSLEARPPNVEGAGEVSVRALVRNALRMRPDRIIVGEVRGGEALDMLQAMNTGHEGSMSTAHANSPRDLLSRLETMALMSDVDLPMSHVREQIAGALDLIIHTSRLPDGRRVAVEVAAVEGLHRGTIHTEALFSLERGAGLGLRALPHRSALPRRVMDRGFDPGPILGRESGEARSQRSGPACATTVSPAVTPDVARYPASWTGSLRRLGSVLE
jgi:pilus assembly protein CpaF